MKTVEDKVRRTKPYTEMTTAELREATKEYDAPTTGNKLPGRPLTAAQRARFERARKRGRSRNGHGSKVISLSVEQGLLKLADSRAKAEGISRAKFFERALESMFSKAG